MSTPQLLRALSVCVTVLALAVTHARVGGQSSAPHTEFFIPYSNVEFSSSVLDSRFIVYAVARPRFHRPTCVSCGDRPFTNFRLQVYVRDYRVQSETITVFRPRLLFEGPRGAQIILFALARGWLVYAPYMLGNRWMLFARNLLTGRRILLDSPAVEGQPSPFVHADTDGATVVWQSWTKMHGKSISVIRSYSLITGKRRLLIEGGTGQDYSYIYPQVSGNRLIFVKEPGWGSSRQILIENLATTRIRALTPPGAWNDEPSISGNFAAWVHGPLTVDHSHGLVVANLTTGRRTALKHSSAQLPRVIAGRYVVFGTDYSRETVQVYDSVTGQRRTIAGPDPDASGSIPGGLVQASDTAVLYQLTNACGAPAGHCPGRMALRSLP